MNDFTKSILYSGVVLAAGLIAVFAIQSNMTGAQKDAGQISSVEPAAGQEGFSLSKEDEIFLIKGPAANSADDMEEIAEMDMNIDAAVQDLGEEIQNIEPAAGEEEAVEEFSEETEEESELQDHTEDHSEIQTDDHSEHQTEGESEEESEMNIESEEEIVE